MNPNFKFKSILLLVSIVVSIGMQVLASWDLTASLHEHPNEIDLKWKWSAVATDSILLQRAESSKEKPDAALIYKNWNTLVNNGHHIDIIDLKSSYFYHYRIKAKSGSSAWSKVATGALKTTATGPLSNAETVCPSDLSLDSAQLVRLGACELVFRYECPKPKTTNAYLVKTDHTMLPLKILSQNASRLQVKVPRDWQKYQFWKVAMDGKMDSLSIR
jgi:hypothetical protein